VLQSCHALAQRGQARITYLPVDTDGLMQPDALAAVISPDTMLVSVMHANNETGVVQPVANLARVAHAYGALMHTDAAQSIGKLPVDVDELGVDLLTVAGHKLYAPKGVGALYIRPGTPIAAHTHGGGQEHGCAPAPNVALIVALGAAGQLARTSLATESDRQRHLRDRLYQRLQHHLDGRVKVNGHPDRRLPNTLLLAASARRVTPR
jgi:cysteine desulfurase